MSQENVEVARRAYDAFSRADFEAFAALLHPEVEFESLVLEVEAKTYRGLDGAREYFQSIRDVFPDWTVEITQVQDFGDKLVIESRTSGTGKAAESALNSDSGKRERCVMDKSSGGSSFAPKPRLSKPWGCSSSAQARAGPSAARLRKADRIQSAGFDRRGYRCTPSW